MVFITLAIEQQIKTNVIDVYLPKLNKIHKDLLCTYLLGLLEIICSSYNLDADNFMAKLVLNNYKDVKWLLSIFIPYIDNSTKKLDDMTKLDELYIEKYTNIQYNRCNRNIGYIKFDKSHLDHNYYLLLHTISSSRNKLYINWYDILPYNINTYKTTKLYDRTLRKYNAKDLTDFDPIVDYPIENIKNQQYINNVHTKLSGLSVEDIYNTISNDLFNSIVYYKWLIFDIKINGKIYPYIKILNDVLDISNILNGIEWDNISNRRRFIESWNNFKKKITIYSDDISGMVLKCLGVFYDKRDKIDKSDKTYDEHGDIDEPLTFYDDKHITYILNKALPENIYKFILNSINSLKMTWYSYHIFTTDKTQLKPNIEYNGITMKNVYNFCKNMIHYDNFVRMPNTWQELDRQQQAIFLDRLNRNIDNWFNITKILKFIHKVRPYEIKIILDNIYATICNHLIDIIFETLIHKGVLSKFIIETDLTNNEIYNMSNDTHKKKFIEIVASRYYNDTYGDGSYYYLTGTTFNNVPKDKLSYFDLCKKTAWFISPTYHWVSQIGFCHHFLNNRVMFITGGTGAGKTTQIPKLYIYNFKALEYNSNATVCITVPRISIINTQIPYINSEFGIPKGNNYMQYSFKGKNNTHIIHGNYLKIKFMTDGIILKSVQDPLLKLKSEDEYPIYNSKNLYDVLIIDEAHEHNKNMDMILTLARYGVKYNNSMRLAIMSATIDADEPYYRRFYRDINDNLKYPLNQYIKQYNIDRINVDRRYHISAPEDTTRYTITEHYKPNEDIHELIQNIISKTHTGDILLFQPGIGEIVNTVKILNKENFLPPNVIALPYHAQLKDDNVKLFLDSIVKNLQFIGIDKTDNNLTNSRMTEAELRGNKINRYTRFVFVATNMAEASITIDSLKFVVDTGTEKRNIFDIASRKNKITLTYINDASRLQRRGRVGRRSPGIVYYMYNKGNLTQRKQFAIAIEDVQYSILFELLRKTNQNPIFTQSINDIICGISHIFNEHNAIQIQKHKQKLHPNVELLINNYKQYANKSAPIEHITSLCFIIYTQYTHNNELYNYYGNNEHYDYQNIQNLHNIYYSGFDADTLTDDTGTFYIIHPDELVIKRNMFGSVIEGNENVKLIKNKMNSKKINTFWEILLDNAFVVKSMNTLYKTEYGLLYINFLNKYIDKEDINILRVIIYSIGLYTLNNEHERNTILSVLGIIDEINNSNMPLSLLFEEQYSRIKHIIDMDVKSDIHTIINIINFIKNEKIKSDIVDKINNKIKYYKKKWKEIESDETIQKFRLILQPLKNYIKMLNIDFLTSILLLSYPYNIKKKINQTKNSYLSVYNPTPESIYTINFGNTFINNIYKQQYILHMGDNTASNSISLICYISVNNIKLISNIYNRNILLKHNSFNNRYYIDKFAYKLLSNKSKNINFKHKLILEYGTALTNINKTIQVIYEDIKYIFSNGFSGLDNLTKY